MKHLLVLMTVVVTLGALALGGCVGRRSTPSRFYVLQPLPSETRSDTSAVASGVAVGVGPVVLPQYLDRPEIVTRTSRNELHMAEFHRWAEPLDDAFARALAENLSVLLSTDRVSVYPWPSSAIVEYQLEVEVLRFEANESGDVSLIARWSITRPGTSEVPLTRQCSFNEVANGEDFEATIAAMDRAITQLSRQIAGAIESLSQEGSRH